VTGALLIAVGVAIMIIGWSLPVPETFVVILVGGITTGAGLARAVDGS